MLLIIPLILLAFLHRPSKRPSRWKHIASNWKIIRPWKFSELFPSHAFFGQQPTNFLVGKKNGQTDLMLEIYFEILHFVWGTNAYRRLLLSFIINWLVCLITSVVLNSTLVGAVLYYNSTLLKLPIEHKARWGKTIVRGLYPPTWTPPSSQGIVPVDSFLLNKSYEYSQVFPFFFSCLLNYTFRMDLVFMEQERKGLLHSESRIFFS